eukprot:14819437-Heterocapsa_arctica.AAC.1
MFGPSSVGVRDFSTNKVDTIAFPLIAVHEVANVDLEFKTLRQLVAELTTELAASAQGHSAQVAQLQQLLDAAVRVSKDSLKL